MDQAVATARVKLKERLVDPIGLAPGGAEGREGRRSRAHLRLRFTSGPPIARSAWSGRVLDGLLVRADETAPGSGGDPRKPQVAESWAVARGFDQQWKASAGSAQHLLLGVAFHAAACALKVPRPLSVSRTRSTTHWPELFFATFYQAWKLASWNTVAAFRHAWQTVRQNQALHGTGIVLWSARSIRETLPGYWTAGARFETKEMNRLWTQAVEKDRITAP